METNERKGPPAGTFRSVWAHRRWRWLMGGFAVSLTGDFLYTVALVVFLIDRTGSAAWVSAAVVARLVPYAVLGAPAGVLADRWDRRRMMLVLDLARAGVLLVLALVAWTGGPAILAVALAVVASVLATPYRPAAVAATPLLVGEDDLSAANAAEGVIAQAAWFVGPALGAGLVALSGVGAAFAIDAATFVVSAALGGPSGRHRRRVRGCSTRDRGDRRRAARTESLRRRGPGRRRRRGRGPP